MVVELDIYIYVYMCAVTLMDSFFFFPATLYRLLFILGSSFTVRRKASEISEELS